MAKQKIALGKGLGALLDSYETEKNLADGISHIDIQKIFARDDQPRKFFDENKLNELAASIKQYGVLQPIIVKRENSSFRIIAGERRWRASKIAGLTHIPCIVKEKIEDFTIFEISLIENLQRENLNPIEESDGYSKLIDAFNYTHEKLAKIIGKDRSYITNSLRLLKLSDKVKNLLIDGTISTGHAKLLVPFSLQRQIELADIIVEKGLTVRELERLLSLQRDNTSKVKKSKLIDPFYKDNIAKISDKYQTKVEVNVNKRNKGKIVIHFNSKKEFEKLIEEL